MCTHSLCILCTKWLTFWVWAQIITNCFFLTSLVKNHSGISYTCHFEVNSFAYRSWTLICLTQRHSSCMKHLSATSCLKSTANLNSRTTPPYGIPSKIYTWNCFTCITESVSSFSMYRLVSNNCIVHNFIHNYVYFYIIFRQFYSSAHSLACISMGLSISQHQRYSIPKGYKDANQWRTSN